MKVVISDITLTGHPEEIRTALMDGDPDLALSDIEIRNGGLQADLNYAQSNGAVLVIRSTTGASSYLDLASSYYNNGTGILVCMPAGANSIGEVFHESIPQDMCITGAGDIHNETADNVEFISNDPITPETTPDEQDLSSFSNGYIGGQLLKIKDSTGYDWEKTRDVARITSSSNNVWSETDGYGFIDVNAAISFSIGTVGNITVERIVEKITGCVILITIDEITNAAQYEIRIFKEGVLYETIVTTDLTYEYTLLDCKDYTFDYRGINSSFVSDYSTTASASNCFNLVIGSIKAERFGDKVNLFLTAVPNATSYKIYRDGVLISTQTGLTYTDTLTQQGNIRYTYMGYNPNLTSHLSEPALVKYFKINYLIIR